MPNNYCATQKDFYDHLAACKGKKFVVPEGYVPTRNKRVLRNPPFSKLSSSASFLPVEEEESSDSDKGEEDNIDRESKLFYFCFVFLFQLLIACICI